MTIPVEPVNILLVDDKPENLVVLEELLAQPDRTLLKATSGNDALRLLLKTEVALVLLDLEMPLMDGYEVAQLMRSATRTAFVPIIFVTAGDRSEERTFRGYEAGAVDFLYKPINAHTMQSKVNVFIDLHRKSRELVRVNRELEATTAKLQEKLTDLENVSQTLSHDLRAPLRSIRSFSQILAEALADKLDEESRDALDRVLRGSERMAQMVDDLYRLLRLSSDGVVTAELDSEAVLVDVLENLRTDLDQAGATVTHHNLPRVRSNRFLLSQILQNLISNAIKFRGPDKPMVQVSAARTAQSWVFAVRDNGIGIAPENHERVFGLFQRVRNAGAGTGVGLALCKRAVEKLGGRIWIEDSSPGATFVFTIPDRAD